MKILVCQINPTIGDLNGNTEKILDGIQLGRSKGVDLIIFPELALCGYPPEDFLLLPHFIDAIDLQLEKIISNTEGIAVLIGMPRRNQEKHEKPLFNSAALIENKVLVGFADKILLPTYDVFDERRYFEPGDQVKVWAIKGERIGVTICEDLWQHSGLVQFTQYCRNPVAELKNANITALINISSSPYSFDKLNKRVHVCLEAARSLKCPLILCNQVGGNDSLIFDGYSVCVTEKGVVQQAAGFREDHLVLDLSQPLKTIEVKQNSIQDLLKALILGLKDYFGKLGLRKACLGLSGGIDSAVVAYIASQALGHDNILALGMPSRYTSFESCRDAALLSNHLKIEYKEISIEKPFESYLEILEPSFKGKSFDVAEENLQARIRGMILMAFSNKFGYLVLSTGNKSELALGYSTLYGDMCGGLAVIGDLTKNQVYALAQEINKNDEIIPRHTIERAPSAELRPNQKDSDTLPSYEIIDHVLKAYIEDHRSSKWIAEHFGYAVELVDDLIKRIHFNEYKRRQAPPVLRVSEKSFSVGRRFPIVQKWV